MQNKPATVITGTGCYIPDFVKTNRDFTGHNFYAEDNKILDIEPHIIVEKFKTSTRLIWQPLLHKGRLRMQVAIPKP